MNKNQSATTGHSHSGMASEKSKRSFRNNPTLVIFLTVFMDLVGFGIVIPMNPYITRAFGGTSFDVGLLMATYSAMQFLFSPFWGKLSDRFGRRPILLLTIAGTVFGHLMFYYAGSLAMLFVARVVAGFFGANISTAMAAIADVTTEDKRSSGMGLIGAAFGLGFILGPALGGISTKIGIVTGWGEQLPALVAAGISTINFVSAYFQFPETLKLENRVIRERKSRIKDIIEKINRPLVGRLLLVQFLGSVAMANMEASMFLMVADRFGWGMEKASFGFMYVGLSIALVQGFLVRKLMPKYGERKLLIVGYVFFILAMAGIGAAEVIWFLAIANTFLALGHGLLNPAVNGSLSLLATAKEQGELMGVNQSLAALARVFGPPIGGYLYKTYGTASPFYAAAVFGMIAMATLMTVNQELKRFDRGHAK
jgi:DHA1 family tetracycline resistance protein-like MFS transporter